MARPKTRGDLKTLNINIKAEVSEELNRYVEKTGITKNTYDIFLRITKLSILCFLF